LLHFVAEFAADLDIRLMGLDGVGGDEGAFNKLTWFVREDLPILARSWFALVCIDDLIVRLIFDLLNEFQLCACEESGAAPPTGL
jgi:hypothetical protein